MEEESVIDLRSDLLSRPSERAIAAMADAARNSGAFGLREDRAQHALERQAAALLGKEDALVFPTCTMANEVALLLLGCPGETVVTQEEAHVVTSEAGAPAALAGLMLRPLPGGPMPSPAAWAQAAERGDELKSRVSVFVIENTHNRSGGCALLPGYTAQVTALARAAGVRCHLDGARLFNAAIATGTSPAALAGGFDTVAVSLNKGLGAPLGAVLAGSHDLIARALTLRQRLGGGIRPTGIVAAPALAMLDAWESIAEDHRRARRLADALAGLPGAQVEPEPQTNIVLLVIDTCGLEPALFCAELARRRVLALPFGPQRVRFVTYRGLTDADIDQAADAIAAALRTAGLPTRRGKA